ncbi:MAG: ribosomal protein S18-alanine N-acetyltransferase [Selenomonadaceae bacterium]|nr:ribosomal protein S18-alanine N-acetyltransferase [Selenomonadaceae bacterium]
MGQTPQITFRDMKTGDAITVEEIENRSFKSAWSLLSFVYEAKRDDSIAIVGEIDGQIVAYACVWISFDEADVANIAVDEPFRGQGIGTKLFEEIIRRVKLIGIKAMTLEVRPSNSAAIKLYENFGLHIVGRRKGYYEDGEDALIMWNTKL